MRQTWAEPEEENHEVKGNVGGGLRDTVCAPYMKRVQDAYATAKRRHKPTAFMALPDGNGNIVIVNVKPDGTLLLVPAPGLSREDQS
jgi:hypothetical protein